MLRSASARTVAAAVLATFLTAGSTAPSLRDGEPPPAPAPAASIALPPPPAPTVPPRHTQLGVPENNPLELYPPQATSSGSPLTVALHGADQDPVDLCEAWNEAGRAKSWLICPAGNAPSGAAFDWGGPTEERIAAVDAQLAAVDEVYGPLVAHDRGDVLVGFSRGAFLARDLVYARPGRFRGMILLGAAVTLDPARLKAAGIQRVVLASGELDGARASMAHTAEKLSAHGLPARFFSLGKIYHALPPDLGRVMREALAWIREGDG
jgi:predicted esterase